jgi:alanine dehydrogenase
MAKVELRILNRQQVNDLKPERGELVEIIAEGLRAHALGNVVLPPKAHIDLDSRFNGHFNILVGWAGPADLAGVKVISDYVDNFKHGLPSEVALLTLYDPRFGTPVAILDATDLTTWRTGAVTALGARHLAPKDAKVLAHIGARGTAFSNIELLSREHEFEDIRIHSLRPESRERLAQRVRDDLHLPARAVDSTQAAVADADIVIEATRLESAKILIRDEWLKRDCLLVCYGWKMAVDPQTVLTASKVVVDDWNQCCVGGQLHDMIVRNQLTAEMIHAEIGEVLAGRKSGRSETDGRIVFWHRGFAISDIMLGRAILVRAIANSVGLGFTLFDVPDE